MAEHVGRFYPVHDPRDPRPAPISDLFEPISELETDEHLEDSQEDDIITEYFENDPLDIIPPYLPRPATNGVLIFVPNNQERLQHQVSGNIPYHPIQGGTWIRISREMMARSRPLDLWYRMEPALTEEQEQARLEARRQQAIRAQEQEQERQRLIRQAREEGRPLPR